MRALAKLAVIPMAAALGLYSALSWPVRSAEDASPIVGTWRVTSFSQVTTDTSETSHPFGENPIGYIQYSPGHHVAVFLQASEQKKPAKLPFSDAERIEIHKGIIAGYVGTYTVEGNKVTLHIVASARPDWIGGDQVRNFSIDGKNLTITTAPLTSGMTGKQVVSTLTFERIE